MGLIINAHLDLGFESIGEGRFKKTQISFKKNGAELKEIISSSFFFPLL